MDAISPTSFARFNDALVEVYDAESTEVLAAVVMAHLSRLVELDGGPDLAVSDEALLHEFQRHIALAHARLLRGAQAPPPPPVALTGRERDVVIGVARGLSNPRIATALSISVNTVKTHLKHLMSKTGARNRAELVFAVFGTWPKVA